MNALLFYVKLAFSAKSFLKNSLGNIKFVLNLLKSNDDFIGKVWHAYLVNDFDFYLDSVIVLSKTFATIDGEMLII